MSAYLPGVFEYHKARKHENPSPILMYTRWPGKMFLLFLLHGLLSLFSSLHYFPIFLLFPPSFSAPFPFRLFSHPFSSPSPSPSSSACTAKKKKLLPFFMHGRLCSGKHSCNPHRPRSMILEYIWLSDRRRLCRAVCQAKPSHARQMALNTGEQNIRQLNGDEGIMTGI